MQITKHSFGRTADGREVALYRVENRAGGVLELLDYGCTIRAIRVPDRNGKLVDVAMGYDTIGEYEHNDGYVGAAIGRFANRICNGEFALNGKTYHVAKNDGENHLHGGNVGFDKHIWDVSVTDDGRVLFSRCSPDGEEGYPGALYVKITYAWSDDNKLTISYSATSDADTILNLTNHTYFNLAGGGSVLDAVLTVHADMFLEGDAGCKPTGRSLPVAGTPFDFNAGKTIGRDIGADDVQLGNAGGYDHNFIVGEPGVMKEVAELYAPSTGIGMRVTTTMPGMQVYSSNFTTDRAGKNGARFGYRDAICLETQFYPDSPLHADFPSTVLHKGEAYAHETGYAFFTRD